MKKFIFILSFLMIVFSLVSCSDFQYKDQIKMNDATVEYDGETHTIRPTGLPDGYVAVALGIVRYQEVGSYDINYAIVSEEEMDKSLHTVSAKLTIVDKSLDPSDPVNPGTEDPTDPNVNPDPNQNEPQEDKVVVYFTQKWSQVYVYAWNDEGSNADWPGVEMTEVAVVNNGYGEQILKADLTGYKYLIFTDGQGQQTEDTEITNGMQYWIKWDTDNNCDMTNDGKFVLDGAPFSEPEDTSANDEFSATINGEAITLTNIKDGGTDKAVYEIELKKDDQISFKNGSDTLSFYHWDNEAINDGDTFTASIDATYTFYINSNYEIYVTTPEE